MTPTGWPTTDLLAQRAATTPDRPALIDGDTGRHWTYRELNERVASVVSELDAEAGTHVGTLLHTGPRLVVTAFAAARLGGTLVLLSPDESVAALAAKAGQTALGVLVCTDETARLADTLASSCDIDRVYHADGVETPADDKPTTADASLSPGAKAAPEPAELDPAHTQVIVFTSGTTGKPKGVKLTVENLRSSAIASGYRLGVDPNDRWLVPLPQYHMGGFAPIVRSALYGTTLVTTRESDPATIARLVDDQTCTGISLVPTMVRSLLEWGWEPPAHLRFVLVGGAPTPPELVSEALDSGIPLHPSYGASETASQIATATPAQARRWPESVGNPLFGTDVAIVDHDGAPVDPGETGELVVSGPTVSPGYLDPEQTAASFESGRFRTGDLGYEGEAGTLWVTGRRSDRIITGGETVDPTEVATALRSHEPIADAAVVGLPDERWGERVAAAVVLEPDVDRLDRDTLDAYCTDRLAAHKRPRTIDVVETLPRTLSGTIDRDDVRNRLESSR